MGEVGQGVGLSREGNIHKTLRRKCNEIIATGRAEMKAKARKEKRMIKMPDGTMREIEVTVYPPSPTPEATYGVKPRYRLRAD